MCFENDTIQVVFENNDKILDLVKKWYIDNGTDITFENLNLLCDKNTKYKINEIFNKPIDINNLPDEIFNKSIDINNLPDELSRLNSNIDIIDKIRRDIEFIIDFSNKEEYLNKIKNIWNFKSIEKNEWNPSIDECIDTYSLHNSENITAFNNYEYSNSFWKLKKANLDYSEIIDNDSINPVMLIVYNKYINHSFVFENNILSTKEICNNFKEFGFELYNQIVNNKKEFCLFVKEQLHHKYHESYNNFKNSVEHLQSISYICMKENSTNNKLKKEQEDIHRFIKNNYIISNDIVNKIKASQLSKTLEVSLRIPEEEHISFRNRLSNHLTKLGLNKKRFSDGYYYYGLEHKPDNQEHKDPITEKDYLEFLEIRNKEI